MYFPVDSTKLYIYVTLWFQTFHKTRKIFLYEISRKTRIVPKRRESIYKMALYILLRNKNELYFTEYYLESHLSV